MPGRCPVVADLHCTVEQSSSAPIISSLNRGGHIRCIRSLGLGAWSQCSCFQYPWSANAMHLHIAFKKVFMVLLVCAVWGDSWGRGAQIYGRCDNWAAVCAIRRRSSRDPVLMHLLHCLFFLEAHYQFELVASHIPSSENSLADDLSRNLLPSFLSKAPHMNPSPSPLPP